MLIKATLYATKDLLTPLLKPLYLKKNELNYKDGDNSDSFLRVSQIFSYHGIFWRIIKNFVLSLHN